MSEQDKTGGIDRRAVLSGALGGAAIAGVFFGGQEVLRWYNQEPQRVAILKAADYEQELADILYRGLAGYPETIAKAKGGRVVLKPNFVEYNADRPINTDARVIYAAAEAFRRAGAREIVIAEGPGHRRDTELLVEQTGLDQVLRAVRANFIDLNVDEVEPRTLIGDYTGFGTLQFPKTILHADLVVSVAKLKTHHWAGATLTMKNLFGTIPGAIYGWPKNPLHWGGIIESIVDIWQALRPGFGIVDGIVGMEGDGPIMGSAKPAGVLVMGDHLPAVDATAARLMGLLPHKILYLNQVAGHGGTISERYIQQIGERLEDTIRPFDVVERFAHIKA